MPKLTVYMVGLIYFSGCDEPEKVAYAPDGTAADTQAKFGVPQHYASLWINADQVETASTTWPAALPMISVQGLNEYRISERSELVFPDQNNELSCVDLDAVMPKLKKDKKRDEDEEPFQVDPLNAITIAKVKIRGGALKPFDLKSAEKKYIGVVQWTIDNPSGLEITAGPTRKITLKSGVAAEVVFSNIHSIALNTKKDDANAGDHIQLFKQLNPGLGNVTLVADKPGPLPSPDTDNNLLGLLRGVAHTCGVTPPCCAKIVHD